MRLLILDESWEVMGGVDTFRRAFIPAAARLADKVVWACSVQHSLSQLGDLRSENIEMVDLHPPSRSLRGFARAGLRRLPGGSRSPWTHRTRSALSQSYLRDHCRHHGLTHILELCVHRQPFPELGLPTAGYVHDLAYENRGKSPLDVAFRDWLQHASKLFTNSTQTRAELLELEPDAGGKVEVVLLASTEVQLPPAGGSNPFTRSEPVLYYPAGATWHKGHDLLLGALTKLAGENVPFHCYLSGYGTNWMFDDDATTEQNTNDVRLNCRKFRHALAGRVTLLGRQPWEVLEQLYQAANLVVLPTRFEGFGLPLSEALRRSKPVSASRLAPMEEQVTFYGAEDQVRWVPPGDETALTAALRKVLTGADKFWEFSPALKSRMATWNWDAVARTIVTSMADAET